jgi:hypothetical protein
MKVGHCVKSGSRAPWEDLSCGGGRIGCGRQACDMTCDIILYERDDELSGRSVICFFMLDKSF